MLKFRRQTQPNYFSFLFLLILLFFGSFSFSQPNKTKAKPVTRILFILDASYSMYSTWQSGMRMDIAKNLLTEFLDSVKNVDDIQFAFRAYGHQSPIKPVKNCQDTKLEVPFGENTLPAIKNKIKTLVPKGTTPIAYTLEQAANDFPDSTNCKNIIILITDGIEECGGDPCTVSLALQKKGIILRPYVIGIGMNENFMKAFSCMGKFYDASSESSFKNILNVIISRTINNTTAQVNLLDQNGKPTETDVNMTFYDAVSEELKYNYIHTINHKGNPDTIVLDPLRSYRMVVNTIPPVEKSSIELIPSKHNIISVNVPQGYLNLKTNGTTSNYKSLPFIVRKSGEMKTLHVQELNKTEKYITGKYDLEILTLPRIFLNTVQIAQSTTTTIEIAQSGNVTVLKPAEGPGSVFVEENNQLVWVYNLKDNLLQETITLQPGKYRVEYRPKNAKESVYTIEKKFKIESGSSSLLKLY